MKILLTNDDGVHAPGLKALAASMPSGVEVVIAAPATQRSASSHAITLGQKLRVEEDMAGNMRRFSIHGTPADCVKFALAGIPDFFPDLIVSGINQGANTGVSVYYSGTISAVREGFINKVPAVAVSLCDHFSQDFTGSQIVTRQITEGYMAGQFPLDVMLSVNVPSLPSDKIKGIKITKQAASHFVEEFLPEKAHDGKKVFTLAGEIEIFDPDGTSDEEAVLEGYVSITPLKIDLTDYRYMKHLQEWTRSLKGSN